MTLAVIVDRKSVDVEAVHRGNLMFLSGAGESDALVAHAIETCNRRLSGYFDAHRHSITEDRLQAFAEEVSEAKNEFTNGEKTKTLLLDLIKLRYEHYRKVDLFFDLPRLRIIPPSFIYRSGVSYNYQPHRDSWYGGTVDQVNHWLSVRNVTTRSTFYIAPSFFSEVIPNTSNEFDLDVWHSIHRPAAARSTTQELRPHPSPAIEIPESAKISVVMDPGTEVVFSGTHLHGSTPNASDCVRLSIDYRVVIPAFSRSAPNNIDSSATGDYSKFLLKHPHFNV